MKQTAALEILSLHKQELKQFGIRSLALFGSVSRGEARPDSDFDILVEFERPVGLLVFLRIQHQIEELLGGRVDLVTPRALKRQLRDRILKEAVYVT